MSPIVRKIADLLKKSMYKFFVNEEQIEDNRINIIGEDVNHIKNVLRLSI